MARSYDEGAAGGGDDKKPNKGSDGHPVKDEKSKGAVGGQCHDEENDELLPVLSPPPQLTSSFEDNTEESQEGQHLFADFMLQQIQRHGFEPPNCVTRKDRCDPQLVPLDWTRAGRELRQLSDAFATSRERDFVRNRASEVNLESLNMNNFIELLQELFQGDGITRERILVLFFFCADVGIEALRQGYRKTFHTIFRWSLSFVASRVAAWVRDNGGWQVVLTTSLSVVYQVTACIAFMAITMTCVFYIRRNLS